MLEDGKAIGERGKEKCGGRIFGICERRDQMDRAFVNVFGGKAASTGAGNEKQVAELRRALPAL